MNINLPLNSNTNKKAVNTDFFQTLELNQTSRQIPVSDIDKIVNTYQVFDDERNACTKYRLTATINTIATNVLINPLTQIYNGNAEIIGSSRLAAIQTINSGYTYNCGYDIFDNNFLRVNTFKTGTTLNDFTGTTLNEVLSIQDAVDNNLFEDNGWMYFTNVGKINNDLMFVNNLPCAKIDLFPTRDYFSFKPMVISGKTEDNWDYSLTYPYRSKTDHILVTDDNGVNGIPIITGTTGYTNENGNYLQIVTPYNNNLSQGDIITFNYVDSPTGKTYQVYSIGDINGLDTEHTFLLDIDKYSDLNDLAFVNNISNTRIAKVISGVESNYYIREFRKIPNFKFDTDEITIQNIANKITGNTTEIASDSYQLAFSRNIFGDKLQQIQFIDDIDINLLSDNLGRPLSEIFLTIIKRNINSDPTGHNKVFGEVTSGFDELPGVTGFTNARIINSNKINEIPLESNITISGSTNDNIFLGDIVEYNKSLVKETVLEEINHRFNTTQRELTGNTFTYSSIKNDYSSFTGTTINLDARNEGYYYKPHYLIPIKNYSSIINQGELDLIENCDSEPFISGITFENNVINLSTFSGPMSDLQYLTLRIGDTSQFLDFDRVRVDKLDSDSNITGTTTLNIRLRDDIINSLIIPYISDFFGLISSVNSNIYQFKQYYSDLIPSYGEDMNNGRILWRNILPEGVFDTESVFTTEIQFTNGRLYLNQPINLYVRRQDPFGDYGLKGRTFPSDLYGDSSTNDVLINNRFSNPDEIC